jgi:hypothetical protein
VHHAAILNIAQPRIWQFQIFARIWAKLSHGAAETENSCGKASRVLRPMRNATETCALELRLEMNFSFSIQGLFDRFLQGLATLSHLLLPKSRISDPIRPRSLRGLPGVRPPAMW